MKELYKDPDSINLSPEEVKIIWDIFKPKLDNMQGTLIFYGTAGEMGVEDFGAIFYKPESYNLKEYEEKDKEVL